MLTNVYNSRTNYKFVKDRLLYAPFSLFFITYVHMQRKIFLGGYLSSRPNFYLDKDEITNNFITFFVSFEYPTFILKIFKRPIN